MAVANLPWVTEVAGQDDRQHRRRARPGHDARRCIPRVKNVVAVASGKGGVGKSTTSVNLAVALSQTGARVGLLDADIYGPNVPLMMGIKEKPEVTGAHGGAIDPVVRFGIKLVSIGFFLDESKPVIWRGPMVHGAIQQFLRTSTGASSTTWWSICRRARATRRSACRSSSRCRAWSSSRRRRTSRCRTWPRAWRCSSSSRCRSSA